MKKIFSTENLQSIDRNLIAPILIGAVSVIGMCILFTLGRFSASRSAGPMTATDTPFKYVYLGTEPGVSTEVIFATETLPSSPTSDVFQPSGLTALFLTLAHPNSGGSQPASTATAIGIVLPTSTSAIIKTATPTTIPSSTTTALPNTFDDTDFRLTYSGDWTPLTNIADTTLGTLHVSSTIGDSVSFSFLGQQFYYYYQAGPSLGIVTITIDGLGFAINQSSDITEVNAWISGILAPGTHTVVITHSSGGSVNVDAVNVPSPNTATPTVTPTP